MCTTYLYHGKIYRCLTASRRSTHRRVTMVTQPFAPTMAQKCKLFISLLYSSIQNHIFFDEFGCKVEDSACSTNEQKSRIEIWVLSGGI